MAPIFPLLILDFIMSIKIAWPSEWYSSVFHAFFDTPLIHREKLSY